MGRSEGFTLVELIVVMSIIAILLGFGGTSYVNSLRSGRDADRRGDMTAFQQAFEQYFSVNGAYIADCPTMTTGVIRGEYPRDPLGAAGGHSDYAENCPDTVSYCMCAELERANSGNACDNGCTFDDGVCSADFFCVQNQQ